MRPYPILLFFLLLPAGGAMADEIEGAAPIPGWFLEQIATLTAGSGRWITDNSEYRSEQEPAEAYVTEWYASFDGTAMRGRLFGITGGEETADFWEFRQFWHPQTKVAVVEQFGFGGVVGLGTMWLEEGVIKSSQEFFTIDGSSSQVGHASYFSDDATHVTDSFDIVDDQWKPRRHYVWRLAN